MKYTWDYVAPLFELITAGLLPIVYQAYLILCLFHKSQFTPVSFFVTVVSVASVQ